MKHIKARISNLHGTTLYWNNRIGFIPKPGEIIIYDDYDYKSISNNTVICIPGIKIGTGNAYVQDLPFVDEITANEILNHINNSNIHVSQSDKEFWNNKINIIENIDDEILKFTRE